ncbi:hypothetical protein O1W69_03120 [Chlamydia sp. 12-01]|uniref:hypothetical protein n=1 Tax=Chlamydia sp. 12-01 TaxID=3002742 RepID=UPI0035D4FD5B
MTAPIRPNSDSSNNNVQRNTEVRNDENTESLSETNNEQVDLSNQIAIIPIGRDVVQDVRMVSEAALIAVHGLIFPYISMVISMAGISLHSSCRTVNSTEEEMITYPFPSFSEALEDGDIYAVS